MKNINEHFKAINVNRESLQTVTKCFYKVMFINYRTTCVCAHCLNGKNTKQRRRIITQTCRNKTGNFINNNYKLTESLDARILIIIQYRQSAFLWKRYVYFISVCNIQIYYLFFYYSIFNNGTILNVNNCNVYLRYF